MLSGANTFNTGFNLADGALIVGSTSALGSGALTIADGTTIQSATAIIALPNAVTVDGNFTFGGSLAVNGVTFSGGVDFGDVAREITVTNPLVTSTISGQITGSGSGLTKAGAGELVLSNAGNATTFDTSGSQAIVVDSGVLEIQGVTGTNLEALGINPTSVVANNIVIDGGTLNFNPTSATATLSANRGVVIGGTSGAGTGAIGVASGKTVSYSGIIADDGTGPDTLYKVGAGTLFLSGISTFTGGVTVEAGTLKLGATNAISNGSSLVVASGATFDVGGFFQTVGSLSGDTATTGGKVTNNGSVAATLTVGFSNTDSTFAGVISSGTSPLRLTKVGTGAQTLTAANTYTGATVVSGGTLVVSGSISGTSSVTVGGATGPAVLQDSGAVTTAGGVNVTNKGFLTGSGTVNGAVDRRFRRHVGAWSQRLGLTLNTGPVKLQSGSTFQLSLANGNAEAGGAPSLTDYSKLTLGTGVSATLGGTIVTNVSGAVNPMDLFTIILSGAPVTGIFANTTPVSGSTYAFTSGAYTYEINYAFNSANYQGTQGSFEADTGGNSVALLVLAVPEPNSWSMLMEVSALRLVCSGSGDARTDPHVSCQRRWESRRIWYEMCRKYGVVPGGSDLPRRCKYFC